jgi:hypothetical protein
MSSLRGPAFAAARHRPNLTVAALPGVAAAFTLEIGSA